MNYKEATKVLGGLLDAFDRDEHGDYFYEHGWEVCEATILAYGALQNQPFWIPVEEKLPEEFVSVLVYMPDEKPMPTVHEGFLAREGMWYANHFDREPMEITHWMPLPEPPEVEV